MTLTILYRHFDALGDGNDRFARMTCLDNVDLNIYIGQNYSINFANGNTIELTINADNTILHMDFSGHFTTKNSGCLVHALEQCIHMIDNDVQITVNDKEFNEAYEKWNKQCGD